MDQVTDKLTSNLIKLFVMEKDEIYRYMYQPIPSKGPIELLGVSTDWDITALKQTVALHHPDVLLIGTKRLDGNLVEELDEVRIGYPRIGIVILLMSYSSGDIEMLRLLATKSSGGVAVVLRQSLAYIKQLVGIITSVSYGQVILDPTLANLMLAGKPQSPFLKQLTTRELEILSLLAKGHTNAALADALFIDIKTVEHHLNSIYSKLKSDADFDHTHLRVTATRLYLQEVGKLVP